MLFKNETKLNNDFDKNFAWMVYRRWGENKNFMDTISRGFAKNRKIHKN